MLNGPATGIFGLGIRNDNDTRFVRFCEQNGLVVGGSIFPHKNIHKGTWKSPDGHTVNQIDHICISSRYRSSLQDVRS